MVGNAFPGALVPRMEVLMSVERGEEHPLLVSWIESRDAVLGVTLCLGRMDCLEITFLFHPTFQNLSQTPVLRELLKEVKMSGTIVKIEPPDLALTVCTLNFSL